MDFELNEDQQAIIEAIERLLEKHAGPSRAIELFANGDYDFELHNALIESGFSNLLNEIGGLEAALAVEAIARAGGVVAAGAQLMVAPALQQNIKGPIALTVQTDKPQPVRYAAQAKHLLLLKEAHVQLIALQPDDTEVVKSNFGYPMGRLIRDIKKDEGTLLDHTAAEILENWWRLSLAIEAVGTMEAALNHTVEYVKQRRQFGRAKQPIIMHPKRPLPPLPPLR
jgi:alkylation response protein AidB-like acyl-CoA dehydrogenase